MNVEVPRPALLAARRLGSAIEHLQSTLSVAVKETSATVSVTASTTLSLVDQPGSSLPLGDDRGLQEQRRTSKNPAFDTQNEGSASNTLAVRGGASSAAEEPKPVAAVAVAAATTEEAEAAELDAPPLNAELTGMGPLPFAWYEGCVEDLAVFGDVPLEIDEVASAPDVSQHVSNVSR